MLGEKKKEATLNTFISNFNYRHDPRSKHDQRKSEYQRSWKGLGGPWTALDEAP